MASSPDRAFKKSSDDTDGGSFCIKRPNKSPKVDFDIFGGEKAVCE